LPKKYINGYGLKNIEARIQSMGGEFVYGNSKTGGFYSRISIKS
jgi:signal transduction histidine kinase